MLVVIICYYVVDFLILSEAENVVFVKLIVSYNLNIMLKMI